MNQNTKTRVVYTFGDKKPIGEIEMSDRQFARYIAEAGDAGAMSFADLMTFGCEYTASDVVDLDTIIYVE